ncbi:hypothetical protein [Streptomyces sp. NRRL S-623]|uniref:hypothetical protein n=1 Tax=Streptomyces sp. NRRL S-623 TaxID=1463916 RepID=UPI0004CDBA0F|nr:hypothetical protein [Streptomyces sp. NRRL S-623]
MGDVLLALSIPVLVFASGIYAACDCWTHRAARLAEQDMLLLAGEIVDDAYAALGPLYDRPAARAPAADRPTALSPRPDATPDRVPSRPAPARKP